jgi:type II secretory pathway pseudopilin PulG
MKSARHAKPQVRGFALVASLALMILLTVVAVGLLTLSAVSLRGTSQSQTRSEAQANARLALMLAIGELQKHTGADTRVTAPADIIDPSAPNLTGVWKSWEGTDHDGTGRPIKPAYPVKTKAESDKGNFLTWLVSSAGTSTAPSDPGSFASNTPVPGTIPLLADGSLQSSDSRQIHVVPTASEDGGRFAWWVSPENQKARLSQPHEPRTNDAAGWLEMGQSHLVPNPAVFGLQALIDDPEGFIPDLNSPKPARRALTLASTELIADDNAAEPQHSFHDLSTSATGLLTNTATGGWRKDLSILSEKWDGIYSSYPGGKLPLFRYAPETGSTSQVPKPTTNNYDPRQSNLYPWSEYSLILGYKQPGTYHAASASWASLQSFTTSYKTFSYNNGVVKSPVVWDKIAKQRASSITSDEIYNHKHKQRLHPQIARMQILVYGRATEDPARLNQDPKRYQLNLMYVPFYTLWNPYNITLEHKISGTLNGGQGSGTHQNFFGVGWRRSLPGAMAIVDKVTFPNPDSVPINQYRLLTNGNFQTLDWPNNYANPYDNELNQAKYGTKSTWRDLRTWACWLPEGTLTYKPGEAKFFSPEWIDNGYGFGGGAFRMKEGYNPRSIVGREFSYASNLLASKNYWFLFRSDRLTQPYRDRAPGYGFSVSFGDGSSHFGGTAVLPSGLENEFHNITALVNESEGIKYWPPDEVDEVGYSVGELASGPWIPLFSMSFGPRMTIGTGPGTKQNRPTKGVVQNNALAAMVLSEPDSGKAKDHPANNTFDFAFHSLSIGSTITPNLSDSKGFIGTGYQSGDGLSRLIMAEIPLRPIASLVELQGWNPRGNNPYPPFQMNLIGNSDATPLIPKDNIAPSTLAPSDVQFNLMHDDAYCANHLLFDDWFVSSIAPQPQVLGGNIARNMDVFYRDFLAGGEKLSNRSYQPIPEDSGLTTSQATARVQEIINSRDGWLKVASRLEVDGMFNVNSTSVDAWKAMLGHARSRDEIALHGKDRIEPTGTSNGHAVTRGAAAYDVKAGSGAAIGGEAENASEYLGFRSLTDDQIEDLAHKIVDQVRLRGPFLSLSEFVNRQLGRNNDLALAGAVQTAINNLQEDPMKVLRTPANGLSDNTMPTNDPKMAGADYEFAMAAEGSSAYGVPGWIRQADILRPIAPILSARDDTFTIRAYGDAKDAGGNVVARAWCEAVVKRTRDFCDPSDAADSIEPPVSPANAKFGRRYQIVTFRWLHPDEI